MPRHPAKRRTSTRGGRIVAGDPGQSGGAHGDSFHVLPSAHTMRRHPASGPDTHSNWIDRPADEQYRPPTLRVARPGAEPLVQPIGLGAVAVDGERAHFGARYERFSSG